MFRVSHEEWRKLRAHGATAALLGRKKPAPPPPPDAVPVVEVRDSKVHLFNSRLVDALLDNSPILLEPLNSQFAEAALGALGEPRTADAEAAARAAAILVTAIDVQPTATPNRLSILATFTRLCTFAKFLRAEKKKQRSGLLQRASAFVAELATCGLGESTEVQMVLDVSVDKDDLVVDLAGAQVGKYENTTARLIKLLRWLDWMPVRIPLADVRGD